MSKLAKQYYGVGIGIGIVQMGYSLVNFVAVLGRIRAIGVETVMQSTIEAFMPVALMLSGIVLQAAGGGGQAPTAAQVINDLGAALCRIGAGLVIVLIFWGFSVALAYWSGIDLFHWFKAKRSADSGTRSNAGGHLQGFGKKIAGSMAIGGFPVLLGAIGFSLLDCVVPAMPF